MRVYKKDNIFCKILRKDAPCRFVAENNFAFAFDDLYPKAKVHVIVIPKGEFIDFEDFHSKAFPDQIAGFYSLIKHIISTNGLTQSGFKLISRSGKDGGQEVPHFHVHVLGGGDVANIP
jgi:diadenosine tetraphosphate (Ap4A) HIT family hydrolase